MDKIDIRDLRVGNWVYYDPNVFIEDEYEPTKEIEISQIESGEDIDLIIEDCYAPIPLTKEILEKNGFKEGRFGVYSYRLVDGNDYVYLNDIFTELEYENVCHNYDDPDEVNYGSNMEFPKPLELHQLQNILRDLGIEKEITI